MKLQRQRMWVIITRLQSTSTYPFQASLTYNTTTLTLSIESSQVWPADTICRTHHFTCRSQALTETTSAPPSNYRNFSFQCWLCGQHPTNASILAPNRCVPCICCRNQSQGQPLPGLCCHPSGCYPEIPSQRHDPLGPLGRILSLGTKSSLTCRRVLLPKRQAAVPHHSFSTSATSEWSHSDKIQNSGSCHVFCEWSRNWSRLL